MLLKAVLFVCQLFDKPQLLFEMHSCLLKQLSRLLAFGFYRLL